MNTPDPPLESVLILLDRVRRGDGWDEHQGVSVTPVLEVYGRAVRELRAVALDARERIERAAAVVAEARESARRRRRRADKIAANRTSDARRDG
ncbi:MAG: hypothetical protein HYY76_12020 [Acidobacteria bacterium]|nr:hypothetical protein [Acidobacteriota bacterium]